MAQCRVPHDLGPDLASLSRKNRLLCVSSLFMQEKMLVILRIWCQSLVPDFGARIWCQNSNTVMANTVTANTVTAKFPAYLQ